MAASWRDRVLGLVRKSSGSQLEVVLKRVTQASTLDVPEDALSSILNASRDADSRREMMRHFRICLGASGSQWRRIYATLAAFGELLEKGSPELLTETANGVHFDLLQQLSFLEKYAFDEDERVEALIRNRAEDLRKAWLARQFAAEGLDTEGACAHEGKPSTPSSHQSQLQEVSTTDEELGRLPEERSHACWSRSTSPADGAPAPASSVGSVDLFAAEDRVSSSPIGNALAVPVPSCAIDLLAMTQVAATEQPSSSYAGGLGALSPVDIVPAEPSPSSVVDLLDSPQEGNSGGTTCSFGITSSLSTIPMATPSAIASPDNLMDLLATGNTDNATLDFFPSTGVAVPDIAKPTPTLGLFSAAASQAIKPFSIADSSPSASSDLDDLLGTPEGSMAHVLMCAEASSPVSWTASAKSPSSFEAGQVASPFEASHAHAEASAGVYAQLESSSAASPSAPVAVDWLQVATTHGLYSKQEPHISCSGNSPVAECSLLDF